MSVFFNFLSRYTFISLALVILFCYLFNLIHEEVMVPIIITSWGAHYILDGMFFAKENNWKKFELYTGITLLIINVIKLFS